MPANIPPEILRAPLDKLVLSAKMLAIDEPPEAILSLALNPPDLKNIESTIWSLKEVRHKILVLRYKVKQIFPVRRLNSGLQGQSVGFKWRPHVPWRRHGAFAARRNAFEVNRIGAHVQLFARYHHHGRRL